MIGEVVAVAANLLVSEEDFEEQEVLHELAGLEKEALIVFDGEVALRWQSQKREIDLAC
jgi:hypothetical protein